jgi:hypothetical protein
MLSWQLPASFTMSKISRFLCTFFSVQCFSIHLMTFISLKNRNKDNLTSGLALKTPPPAFCHYPLLTQQLHFDPEDSHLVHLHFKAIRNVQRPSQLCTTFAKPTSSTFHTHLHPTHLLATPSQSTTDITYTLHHVFTNNTTQPSRSEV